MAHRLLTLLAETPVHAGGSEASGIVDLPIQREAATRLPVIWGQSLKGALRDGLREKLSADGGEEERIFGSRVKAGDAGEEPATSKGGVMVGDAQLLLFPVAAQIRTFAWVTSPHLLARLRRRLLLFGAGSGEDLDVASPPGSAVLGGPDWRGQCVLGPFVQKVSEDHALAGVATTLAALLFPGDPAFDHARRKLEKDLLVAEDGVLTELTETATEVVARVQLDEGKTVVNGPFYSEHLPAETILASVLTGPEGLLQRLAELLDGQPLQVGGDETIGKGLMWCRVHDAGSLGRAAAGWQQPPRQAEEARRDAAPSPAAMARRVTR